MPASAWPRNDIVLPKESLTESKRSHQADENYRQTLVGNETYDDTNSVLRTVVCLPACKNNKKIQLLDSTATLESNDKFVEENEGQEDKRRRRRRGTINFIKTC